MEKELIYAPIIITTCNRYEHLKRCIDSLKRNSYASKTELYISIDYPPNECYEEGWKKICMFLDHAIEGFKYVKIFKQEKNLGPFENENFLKNIVFKNYDRLILTEDDNEFSENFIEYMDKGLTIFRDDPKIFGICGYAHNYKFRYDLNDNIIALTDFNAWGMGIWKEKEDIILSQLYVSNWIKAMQNWKNMIKLYIERKRLFSRMLGVVLNINIQEKLPNTDINRGIVLAINNYCTINPVVSKVRNWGWDGSGSNILGSHSKYKEYIERKLDIEKSFEYKYDVISVNYFNNKLLDDNDEWNRKRSRWYNDPFTYILYRILGRNGYFKWKYRKK